MKEIIEFGIVILFLLSALKILLTFVLDRIFKRADKKELKISLIMIGLVEILAMVASIINLTNKNMFLFYIIFILLILYLASSLVFNLLLVNKYLLVNSFCYVLISFILKFMNQEYNFYNYLRTLILSPVSNTNDINYSFIIILFSIMFIMCLINIIKKYKNFKSEQ